MVSLRRRGLVMACACVCERGLLEFHDSWFVRDG